MNKQKRPKAKSEERTPGREKQKGGGGKKTTRPQRETKGSASNTRRGMKDMSRTNPKAGTAGGRDAD